MGHRTADPGVTRPGRGRLIGGAIERQLRHLERRIGAERPDRSVWVWAVPFGTGAGTVTLIIYYGFMGGLQLAASIPLAMFAGLFMFGTSAAYLAAGSEETEAGPERGGGHDQQPSPPATPWFIREAVPWPLPLDEDHSAEPHEAPAPPMTARR